MYTIYHIIEEHLKVDYDVMIC